MNEQNKVNTVERLLSKTIFLFTVWLFLAGCTALIGDQGFSLLTQQVESTSTPHTEAMPVVLDSLVQTTSISTEETLIALVETSETDTEPSIILAMTSTVMPIPEPSIVPEVTLPPTPIATKASTPVRSDMAAPTPLASVSMTGLSDIRVNIITQLTTASLVTEYSRETILFTDHLLAHLPEFKLVSLGITTERMQSILVQDRTEDRINALVQEVWSEWILLSTQQNFDVLTMEPTLEKQGVSPFRQLIIRLIQGRQGILTDSQQHALYGFFSRSEQDATWRNDMDSIIGAVNRESFLWSYGN